MTHVNKMVFTCHFLTNDLSLSVVMVIPWNVVRTVLPCTSSEISLNFLNACSSFCKSASETSNTRPLRPSLASSATQAQQIDSSSINESHHNIRACVTFGQCTLNFKEVHVINIIWSIDVLCMVCIARSCFTYSSPVFLWPTSCRCSFVWTLQEPWHHTSPS